jgi:hypothetical protein
MRIDADSFSAKVDLPCKVFCGPDAMLEFAGTAVNIDTAKLLLQLDKLPGSWQPAVGEKVRLELLLPVSAENASARCMSFRARISAVTELPGGGHRVEFAFRRPILKDRASESLVNQIHAPGPGWAM